MSDRSSPSSLEDISTFKRTGKQQKTSAKVEAKTVSGKEIGVKFSQAVEE